RTLLLTFFYRFMPQIIDDGYLYIAQPPLYSITRGRSVTWLFDDAAKDAYFKDHSDRGISMQRYKGLGEMNAEQLWDTTLNPDTRRLMQVNLGSLDFAGTEALITKLMGKGEAASRRELMELHGDSVEVDV
ncbi:MAG: DNA topoisomerase IV subunit B, partial [Gammaproteobacteria bacterium]|nr:DNA topoisomerase IV subunit B [Gammaproteobacteria bacterium]